MLQEIADDPQIFVGGASRFDIKQGALGEWFTDLLVDAMCLTIGFFNACRKTCTWKLIKMNI